MSRPDVTVKQWAADRPDIHFVTVKLSAQSAADVLEVLKQCDTSCCDASLNQAAFNELVRQLKLLQSLPEPSHVAGTGTL